MSDKAAPVGEVVELESALNPYGWYLSTSRDIRYSPLDFGHYKIYRDVLIEI